MATRLRGFDAPTVWHEITPMAVAYKSENLGQGFPDWETPDFVKAAMSQAISENYNQYCRSGGELSLVQELSKHYSPLVGREIDHMTEITIAVGATGALFAIMQSILNSGDEVVLFEPAFDIYPAQVQMAGGTCKFVPLVRDITNSTWTFNATELEAAITPSTKVLLINSPHNPTGKVFNDDELKQICDILRRHPHVTAVMDEVYEKLTYDGRPHLRLASYPDMWNRTLTVSSAGKTFSCTGWKVGWIFGPAHLIKPIMLANQWIQFSVSTPAQRAMAIVLQRASQPYEGHDNYYDYIRSVYETKRNHLVESLVAANLPPIVPEGGFFVMADTSKHVVPEEYMQDPLPSGLPASKDWGFARWLTKAYGVTPIPPTSFYTQANIAHGENLDRCLIAAREKLAVFGKDSSDTLLTVERV